MQFPLDRENKIHRILVNLDESHNKSILKRVSLISKDNSKVNSDEITHTNVVHINEEDLNVILQTRSNGRIKLTKTDFISCFRINERNANGYSRSGRIFLAGDSAHCHSPAGGQGMNTGMQDVFNLVWKLSSVLNCKSPASICETYTIERSPVADTAISFSNNLTKLSTSSFQSKIVRSLLPTLLKFSIPQKHARHAVMGIKFKYYSDLIYTHSSKYPEFNVCCGERVPDGVLQISRTGEDTTLYKNLRGSFFHSVVWFTGEMESMNDLSSGVEKLNKSFAGVDGINILVIMSENTNKKFVNQLDATFESFGHVFLNHQPEISSDLKSAYNVYGVKKHGTLMLIRPDLIVGATLKYQ
ncbi:hypothetical protein HK096_000834, partial [Nowakowskiella sp. JEL0078]